MNNAYLLLEKRFETITHLENAMAMLRWDSATMMPAQGAEARAEQLATLTTFAHDLLIAPDTQELLENASLLRDLSPWQQANLQQMKHQWRHATAIESTLLAAFSKATSDCEMTWRQARHDNNFAMLAPKLTHVIALVTEIAHSKASTLGCSPYDALLDTYDPGRTSQEIDHIFAELETVLPVLIQEVIDYQSHFPSLPSLTGNYPALEQKNVGLIAMRALGFNFEAGRLDTSHHPFCGGIPSDVRITTRYNTQDFLPALMGILHETGHALYEQNLPKSWQYQPIGKAHGMTLHESQSLFIEMQLCRSKEFFTFITPHLQTHLLNNNASLSAEILYRHATQVTPSFIRVDADEVTYPAHVLLRYMLEKALLQGDLQVKDLPQAWNDGMNKYLGIHPPSDKEGCLQDIHWPGGDFGYFPTYTLGAMTAAQLRAAMEKDLPHLPQLIQNGNFSPIVEWLTTHIHQWGSFYSSQELLQKATQAPLSTKDYLHHLRQRYLNP